MKQFVTFFIGATLAIASSWAAAEQDCILEGEVKKSEASDGKHYVYIDFHSARRYSDESQCRFRQNDIQFDGIVGSQITTVGPGATVKYRYTQRQQSLPTWQLLQISI